MIITLACGICLATLFRNQGGQYTTYAGVLNIAGAMCESAHPPYSNVEWGGGRAWGGGGWEGAHGGVRARMGVARVPRQCGAHGSTVRHLLCGFCR